ncbi:YhgE/Pip family protein [Haloimpatiens sp. FM7330]|uniref:YhgE/Pip family protein n=1 Tax=Haloimpatiens sp. FM7330 TaxID=3298610 RepID=UPI00363C2AF0
MKNILKIFTSDIKNILKNKIALIIVSGLLVLPSLYAWFNIYASWNPYDNTNGIKIAVCNEDSGAKIRDVDVNIGKEVQKTLKKNKALGWMFVENPDKAISLANKGEVYASIIIPKDFSEKISTILSNNPVKPTLEYYVNEKINAISPKITDKGASTIQANIGTSFVESVTEQVISTMRNAGIEVTDVKPLLSMQKETLDSLIKKVPIVIERLKNNSVSVKQGSDIISLSSKDIDLITTVSKDLISFTGDLKKDIDTINSKTDDLSGDIVETLNLTKITIQDLDNNTVKLKEKIILEKPNFTDELSESSINLEKLISETRSIQNSLRNFDKDVSPQIQSLYVTIDSQLSELQQLLRRINSADLNDDSIHNITKSIRELDSKIRSNVLTLKSILQNTLPTVTTRRTYISNLNNDLSSLLKELDGKTSLTEKANILCGNVLTDIRELKNSGINNSPLLLKTLNSIEKNIENLKANTNFSTSLKNLKSNKKVLDVEEKTCSSLETTLKNSLNQADSILSLVNSMDTQTNTIDKEVTKFVTDVKYYSKYSEKDISTIRTNLNKIYKLVKNEHNYLTPHIKEVSDLSLSRLDDISNLLKNLSQDLKNTDNVEKSLNTIHNLNTNMISNIDNLVIKINTDLTSTIKRYLSGISNFSSDINTLLVSVNQKSKPVKDFLNKLSNNGQVTADDMIKFSKDLPKIQSDLILINKKLTNFIEKTNFDKFLDKVQNNKNIIANFMASPVDLNTHALYHTKNYGCAMTPFYTTLALWVGVLILASLLTTETKNIDFEPTHIEAYLGKFLLFSSLSVIQALIVSLGDIFILKVTASDPVLFVELSMFLSLIFCSIVYTLVYLFGNVGKATGVILLVLQVAGSGGTFPIQMTPKLFQKLYAWLPFTYGIGGMREAISGVLFSALKKDVHILSLYIIVSLAAGILLVNTTHKYLEKLSHKLKDSGVTE